MYAYSMNIYVLDKNGTPVPGALVVVHVNGKPKVKGKSRAYTNSPLKLRFNTEAASVRLTVEYRGKLMADQEFLASERDATIELKEVEMPKSDEAPPRPSLIDIMIVMVICSAITIFVFWIATQFLGLTAFERLPQWVIGSYGYFTALGTGSVGLGAAVIQSLRRTGPGPDYVKLVAIIEGAIVGLIVLIILLHKLAVPQPGKSTSQLEPQEIIRVSIPLGISCHACVSPRSTFFDI
jgi:hypothetical protein